jgi:hypothetical protein
VVVRVSHFWKPKDVDVGVGFEVEVMLEIGSIWECCFSIEAADLKATDEETFPPHHEQ